MSDSKTSTIQFCPLLSGVETSINPGFRGRCKNVKCLYHSRSPGNGCAHARLSRLSDDNKERREEVMQLFSVDSEDLQDSINRVHDMLVMNAFFEFLFGHDVIEAKNTQLIQLEAAGEKYATWESAMPKPDFRRICFSVDIIRRYLV